MLLVLHAALAAAASLCPQSDPDAGVFRDPIVTWHVDLPSTEVLRLTTALQAMRALELKAATKALAGLDSPAAAALFAHSQALLRIAERLPTAMQGWSSGSLLLPPPGKLAGPVPHSVESFDAETRELVVVRDGEKRRVAIRDVPADSLIEAVRAAGAAPDEAHCKALGVLLACDAFALTKPAQAAAQKRAAKVGVTPSPLPPGVDQALTACALIDLAGAELATAKSFDRRLDELAAALKKLTDRPTVTALAYRWLPEALAGALRARLDWARLLRGKVTLLPAGRLRVEYDWSDPVQVEDWVPVASGNHGFALGENEPSDARLVLAADGTHHAVRITGSGYVRHALQFEDQLDFTTVPYFPPEKGQDPVFYLHASAPGTGVFLHAAMEELFGSAVRRQRKHAPLAPAAYEAHLKSILTCKQPLTVHLENGGATMRGAGEPIAIETQGVPRRGAVIIAIPTTWPPSPDGAPSGWAGRIVIEGEPITAHLGRLIDNAVQRCMVRFQ